MKDNIDSREADKKKKSANKETRNLGKTEKKTHRIVDCKHDEGGMKIEKEEDERDRKNKNHNWNKKEKRKRKMLVSDTVFLLINVIQFAATT